MSEGGNLEEVKEHHAQLLGNARVSRLGRLAVPTGPTALQKWAFKYLQLAGVSVANLTATEPAADHSVVVAITNSNERDKHVGTANVEDLVWPEDDQIQGFYVVLDPQHKWQLAWHKTASPSTGLGQKQTRQQAAARNEADGICTHTAYEISTNYDPDDDKRPVLSFISMAVCVRLVVVFRLHVSATETPLKDAL